VIGRRARPAAGPRDHRTRQPQRLLGPRDQSSPLPIATQIVVTSGTAVVRSCRTTTAPSRSATLAGCTTARRSNPPYRRGDAASASSVSWPHRSRESPFCRRRGRLGIQHRRRRSGRAASLDADARAQVGVRPLPSTVEVPEPEIVVDHLPGRKVVWERARQCRRAAQIPHGVDQFATVMRRRVTTRFGSGNQGRQHRLFGSGQIRWLRMASHSKNPYIGWRCDPAFVGADE
jgi:hypothetical protein